MALLFNIFSRKVEASMLALDHAVENGFGAPPFVEKNGKLDVALFGDLGEKTSDIRSIFTDLDGRLTHVGALAGDIMDLRQKFGYFLKLYHDLALLNVTLGREKERLETELRGTAQHAAQLDEDYGRLRTSADEGQVKLDKALANIDVYEQNVQLLGVAKRELETKLDLAQAALVAAADEEAVLRRECEALKIRIDGDVQRIDDLSERYQGSFEEATSLRERYQALEDELRLKDEHFASMKDENVKLAHDAHQLGNEKAHLEKLVNDSRAETSANFDRYQKEARLRDEQFADLKNELKAVQSREHMLQKVSTDLKSENEKLARELRDALELNRQNEVQITRYEAKVSRLAADGEAAQTARKQLDQARLAMISRVEALTQALRAGEVDIRRLENEVSTLSQRNLDIETSYAGSLDQLSLRIHELEGQLEHQVNENAYLSSKFPKGSGI